MGKKKEKKFLRVIIVLAVFFALAVIAIGVLAYFVNNSENSVVLPVQPLNLFLKTPSYCGSSKAKGKYELLFYNTDTQDHVVQVLAADGSEIVSTIVPANTTAENISQTATVVLPRPGTYVIQNKVGNILYVKTTFQYPC